MENMKKLNKIIFHNKNIDKCTKLPNPICETRVSKLVFITIPCLKFWAQANCDGTQNEPAPSRKILVI